ncbi:MAG: hypothetical protein IT477_10865 [Rhodanobacteraceae bacterium]|nr:hypothetical protein [Rhodanobacteraceae bacterium]
MPHPKCKELVSHARPRLGVKGCSRPAGPTGYCNQHKPKVADPALGTLHACWVDHKGFGEAVVPVISRGKIIVVEASAATGFRRQIDLGGKPAILLTGYSDIVIGQTRDNALDELRRVTRGRLEAAKYTVVSLEAALQQIPRGETRDSFLSGLGLQVALNTEDEVFGETAGEMHDRMEGGVLRSVEDYLNDMEYP